MSTWMVRCCTPATESTGSSTIRVACACLRAYFGAEPGMKMSPLLRLAALAALLAGARAFGADPPFDLIIAGGHVIDGTGSPWYTADVGIRHGRIAAIGTLKSAAASRRIDAADLVVAPGFIDMLGQSEFTILVDPRLPSKIYQGITTEITGEGTSPGPMGGPARAEPGPCACRSRADFGALWPHSGLAVVWRVFRAARASRYRHQFGFLRGSD